MNKFSGGSGLGGLPNPTFSPNCLIELGGEIEQLERERS